MMNFSNKNIFILGLGLSSIAAAKKLTKLGANIYIFDDNKKPKDIIDQELQNNIKQNNIIYCHYNEVNWQEIDLLLLAPAIATNFPQPHQAVILAKKFAVKITIDIELFVNLVPKANIVAVTGTNGKSTTASLIYHILQKNNKNSYLGGNIGVAVFDLEINNNKDVYYVLELSSYQLELIDKAAFNVAILLNITPDHIDRHGNIENYVKAKKNIFKNKLSQQKFVISIDDNYSREIANHESNILTISAKQDMADLYATDHYIKFFDQKLPLDLSKFTNCGNKLNILAAFAAASFYSLSSQNIIDVLDSFQPLAYRMEFIGNIGEVNFINDSKATNGESSYNAISQLQNIYWIAGGVAKEGGIEVILPQLERVKKILLIGQDKKYFAEQLAHKGFSNYQFYDNLEQAVEGAYLIAKEDVKANILFSPAAASFDMFNNFMLRGQAFNKIFAQLKDKYEAIL